MSDLNYEESYRASIELIKDLQEQLDTLHKSNGVKITQISELKQQIKQKDKAIKSCHTEITGLMESFDFEREKLKEQLELAKNKRDYFEQGHITVLEELNDLHDENIVLKARNEKLDRDYNELIMAVAQKFPNESRHETALRYINQREQSCRGPSSNTKLNEVDDES